MNEKRYLWGGIIGFIIVVFALKPLVLADKFVGPEICGACHDDVYTAWKASHHANAFSEKFKVVWKEHEKKPQCLQCHTTGHIMKTLQYNHPGVSCESCHGAMSTGHPEEAKMPVPISSKMCLKCHKKTFQEWKLSGHSRKNIRCFDCHNVHSQGLRVGGGEKLCGSCHPQRLKDFAHATHNIEGLTCMTCHMPSPADKNDRIEGTGAAGHTLSVGANVCSRCHGDLVHTSSQLPQLRKKVSDFNKDLALAGVKNVFELKEESENLKWKLNQARQSIWVVSLLDFIAGLALGWLGGWIRFRKKNQ